METFKTYAKDIIQEMPYFHYTDDTDQTNNIDFDLEVESKDFNDMSSLIIMALSGQPINSNPEKGSQILHLDTEEKKTQFLDSLLNNQSLLKTTIFNKYGSQINPIIKNVKMPNIKRSPEEIKAYADWINDLVRKSKIISK